MTTRTAARHFYSPMAVGMAQCPCVTSTCTRAQKQGEVGVTRVPLCIRGLGYNLCSCTLQYKYGIHLGTRSFLACCVDVNVLAR